MSRFRGRATGAVIGAAAVVAALGVVGLAAARDDGDDPRLETVVGEAPESTGAPAATTTVVAVEETTTTVVAVEETTTTEAAAPTTVPATSAAPPAATVPAVVGLNAVNAEQLLRDVGFDVVVELVDADPNENGRAVETVPAQGARVEPGSPITLRVGRYNG